MAPRTDGACPACGQPSDGSGELRAVELAPPIDPRALARREQMRHLLFAAALLAGSCAVFWLSWIGLRNGSFLWKPVVIVAVAMLFRGLWELVELVRLVVHRQRSEPLPAARVHDRDRTPPR